MGSPIYSELDIVLMIEPEVIMPVFGRFVASARQGFRGPVPRRLRGGPGQPAALPPVARTARVRNVTVSQPYALRLPPAIMSLNNLRYADPDMEKPRQGTTEIWNIINITPDPHPIHIHLLDHEDHDMMLRYRVIA